MLHHFLPFCNDLAQMLYHISICAASDEFWASLGKTELHFKDVCKRDIKSAAIDIESWELMVKDCFTWRHLVKEEIKHAENTRNMQQVEKRNIRKVMGTVALPNTIFKCERCDKDCHSKIGLFNHQRCCSKNPGANP